jgi:hypothetical protein
MKTGAVDDGRLTCFRCGVPLELAEAKFSYLKHEFSHKVKQCPVCGLVYVPEELAKGAMAEVETLLEDK